MARVLLTWELGGNYGHLTRLLPVARQLRAAGHDVMFAVRETKVADRLLTPESFEYMQAPVCVDRVKLHRPPASYAELLMAEGYASEFSLLGRVNAWLALFRLARSNLLFVDHSPTALVAARAAEIPAIPIGNGFEIPPDVSPLPSIRPWESTPQGLMRSEERVTRSINHCLETLGSRRLLSNPAALFRTPAQLLATFSELDHYPGRQQATYDGPVFTDSGTATIAWKDQALPRVLAYAHNGLPGLKSLVAALQEVEADVVCIVPEIGPAHARKYSSKSLRMMSTPVQLSTTLAGVDLMITQAAFATTSQALLAGIPSVLVPGTVEQYLLAQRVRELGAGEVIDTDRTQAAFTAVINRLLRSDAHREAAKRFATKYSHYDSGAIARRAVGLADALLGVRVH